MNNPSANLPWEREPERFGILTAGMVTRGLAGDLPSGEESPDVFVARLHALYDANPAPLIDGYVVVVDYLLRLLAEQVGSAATVEATRRFTAHVLGGARDDDEPRAVPRDDVLRDVRLSVLGTVRLLLENGTDEDIARLQNYGSTMMLPAALDFLCIALQESGDADGRLAHLTQMTLAGSV